MDSLRILFVLKSCHFSLSQCGAAIMVLRFVTFSLYQCLK